MTCGIYLITNIINNHSYVGQSVNIEKRWYRHSLASDECYFHNAIKKYGWQNFQCKILKEIENNNKEQLNYWEKYYIQLYNTLMPNGYNMTTGGDSNSETIKRKIRQYDKEGIFIQEFDSIKEAGKKLNIDPRHIVAVAKHKRNTAGDYQWCYPEDISWIKTNPKTNGGFDKIPVCQYDLKGNYLTSFESLSAAIKAIGLSSMEGIVKCCNTKGNYSSGGYQWRYKKDYEEKISSYNQKIAHSTTNKAVIQYSKEGIKIAEFTSAKEAADCLNMKKGGNSAILRVCQGKQKTCMGYIWRYKDNG